MSKPLRPYSTTSFTTSFATFFATSFDTSFATFLFRYVLWLYRGWNDGYTVAGMMIVAAGMMGFELALNWLSNCSKMQ